MKFEFIPKTESNTNFCKFEYLAKAMDTCGTLNTCFMLINNRNFICMADPVVLYNDHFVISNTDQNSV